MIPEAAVEAAARALHDRECRWNDWYAIHPGRGSYLDHARAALEAAAPHIEKDAYERGWGAGFRHTLAAMKS